MTTRDTDRTPLEDPLASLERQLITAYLAGTGHDYAALVARDDAEAHRLLGEATRYAATKLSEVEARSHYVRELHGDR